MKIGICGLGKMGHAIAQRLLEEGQTLVVWNRSRNKASDLGVEFAAHPKALVEACDITLSVLSDDTAIDAVYSGPDGLLHADLGGKTIVEMCTTSPKKAAWLDAEISRLGGRFLECPVGGTIGPALEGKLLGLAGGSTEAFEAAKPVLSRLTRRLEHLGPAGNGAAMKLAINLPLMVYWGALGEALSLVLKRGIPVEEALDILSDSSGAIGAAKKRVPPIGKMLTTGDGGAANFALSTAVKDMGLMADLAAAHDHASPIIQAAMKTALGAEKDGWGKLDASLVAAWRNREHG